MTNLSSLWDGLTFYHQKRLDGGLRTGILLGESTVLERFDEGADDYDPSLIWSIDLRCRGDNLPNTAEEARQWLLDKETPIRDGFQRFADELRAGSDPTGVYLLEWDRFPPRSDGVEMKILCGAMRRVDARNLASALLDVEQHWGRRLSALAPTHSDIGYAKTGI